MSVLEKFNKVKSIFLNDLYPFTEKDTVLPDNSNLKEIFYKKFKKQLKKTLCYSGSASIVFFFITLLAYKSLPIALIMSFFFLIGSSFISNKIFKNINMRKSLLSNSMKPKASMFELHHYIIDNLGVDPAIKNDLKQYVKNALSRQEIVNKFSIFRKDILTNHNESISLYKSTAYFDLYEYASVRDIFNFFDLVFQQYEDGIYIENSRLLFTKDDKTFTHTTNYDLWISKLAKLKADKVVVANDDFIIDQNSSNYHLWTETISKMKLFDDIIKENSHIFNLINTEDITYVHDIYKKIQSFETTYLNNFDPAIKKEYSLLIANNLNEFNNLVSNHIFSMNSIIIKELKIQNKTLNLINKN